MVKKSTKKTTKKTASQKPTKTKSTANKERGFLSTAFHFCLKWGFVLGLWLFIIIGGLMLWYASELPNITKSMVFERRPTVIIKANNGEIVDRYGDIKGKIVDVEKLPPHVKQAILATEDRRFYSHFGMDIKGIGRAFFVNIARGGFVQGGSTITQQLAKNLFLTRERTIKRKIQELMLAFQLEYELTKDEILSAYMNRVYLGSGAYGIDAAARVYFNKSAEELDLREAATIAGLLKAPSRFSPNSNPELSAQRTKVVLNAMVDAGYITKEDMTSFAKLPPSPRRKPSSGDSVRYYTDYIISQLDDLIGTIDADITVETTLDVDVQKEMEQSITKAMLKYGPDKEVSQAAGVIMRLDGGVVALMGGRNYSMSEFNRVTDSLRPPGSSFKPIVYLTALENGWSINSVIEDKPVNYGRYRPRNFGHKYYGEVTLYEALTLSLNTVAVSLMKNVGPEKAIGMAQRLGITAKLEPNLSTALGSSGVPMIQMATAYATIGRGGIAVDPYSIKRILDKDGTVLYERTPPAEDRRVVAQSDAMQLNAMMQSVVRNGTGRAAATPFPAAGKTGTSQDFRDAWFIGFTPTYAGAIWFGNDDNSSTKRLTGGSAPAEVWKEVMIKAQAKNATQYASFPSLSGLNEYGFDSLLEQILGTEVEEQRSNSSGLGWFDNLFGGSSSNSKPVETRPKADPQTQPAQEYTPLGRHQYDLND